MNGMDRSRFFPVASGTAQPRATARRSAATGFRLVDADGSSARSRRRGAGAAAAAHHACCRHNTCRPGHPPRSSGRRRAGQIVSNARGALPTSSGSSRGNTSPLCETKQTLVPARQPRVMAFIPRAAQASRPRRARAGAGLVVMRRARRLELQFAPPGEVVELVEDLLVALGRKHLVVGNRHATAHRASMKAWKATAPCASPTRRCRQLPVVVRATVVLICTQRRHRATGPTRPAPPQTSRGARNVSWVAASAPSMLILFTANARLSPARRAR